jgi:excisionase family DNA binding protein
MPEQILLRKRQAAQAFSISIRTLDKLIHSKRLPVHKIGRRVLISRASTERRKACGEVLPQSSEIVAWTNDLSISSATFLFLTFHAIGHALPLDLVLPTGGPACRIHTRWWPTTVVVLISADNRTEDKLLDPNMALR